MQADPLVARIGRISVVICAIATAAAWALAGPRMAAGVLGGGLLIGISFYTLRGGVAAPVTAASGGQAPRSAVGRSLVKLVLRYALLGFLAYVMIARLRLHPIGLLVGVTSVAAAAFVEAVRILAKNR
ncbi:MAG TPA: ATP synthase subunit I [Vicinamibacterales bacterium]